VCGALEFLMERPDAGERDVLKILRRPDFPTGGVLLTDTRLEEL
jgi:DNA gyrase/topoisomerase IV subunit A